VSVALHGDEIGTGSRVG